MYETFFPINDLLRRKFQTVSVVLIESMSVASTLALLLFCERIGVGFLPKGKLLTGGLFAIFSQFAVFVGIVIFALGAVVTSFVVFLMMTQRTKDIGLMKAAGCPNGLVGGYLITELILITLLGCTIGIMLGVTADFAISAVGGFEAFRKPTNYWLCVLVFIIFMMLMLAFGTKPILKAARMPPVKALSTLIYCGTALHGKTTQLSGRWLTLKVAYRSLIRRQSATLRIVVLLSTVFILLTLAIAGGTIASETTISWVENTVDKNVVAIANRQMAEQYTLLMAKFSSGSLETGDFDYLNEKLHISNQTIQQLMAVPGVEIVETQLIVNERIRELRNFTIDPDTSATIPVGGNRETESLVIGIEQREGSVKWNLKGRALNPNVGSEAIVGDSVAHAIYSPNPGSKILFSDPLIQGVEIQGNDFQIVGVCIDPLNGGQVVFVPIQKLKEITHSNYPNIVFVRLDQSGNPDSTVKLIEKELGAMNPDLIVVRLAEIADENAKFLSSAWSVIMLLPSLALISASLCLVGYITLAIDEQRQEFATMRAIGVKQKVVTKILALQSLTVLLSGLGLGMSLGILTTLSILMANPIVTSESVLKIVAWLFSALMGMFVATLLPSISIARSPILRGLGY